VEPLVYIILVNYRGYIDTVDCVKSLLNIKYKNYKIIIVENASSDEDILKKDEFLNAHSKILYASENKGFSDGNNIGIKYARQFKPEYILLLNFYFYFLFLTFLQIHLGMHFPQLLFYNFYILCSINF
jgi:GT2 family glycosyltransferase